MLTFHFAIIFQPMFNFLITLTHKIFLMGVRGGGGGGGKNFCIIKEATKSEHENVIEFYDIVGEKFIH